MRSAVQDHSVGDMAAYVRRWGVAFAPRTRERRADQAPPGGWTAPLAAPHPLPEAIEPRRQAMMARRPSPTLSEVRV